MKLIPKPNLHFFKIQILFPVSRTTKYKVNSNINFNYVRIVWRSVENV